MIKFPLKLTVAILILLVAMTATAVVFGTIQMDILKEEHIKILYSELTSIDKTIQLNIDEQQQTAENYAKALENAQLFSFSTIVVLTDDGGNIYSTSTEFEQFSVSQLGNKTQKFFEQNGSYVSYQSDTKKLIVFAPIDNFAASTSRIMGVMEYNTFSTLVLNAALYGIFQILCVLLVAIAGTVFIVYIFKHRFDLLYYAKPVQNYILKINTLGKILQADANFDKRFERFDLLSSMHDKEQNFLTELMSGNSIILKTFDKEDNHVNLVCNATATIKGYKLVCTDMTQLIDEFADLRYKDITVTYGIWNQKKLIADWEVFIKNHNYASGLMVFFHMLSKDYYSILFGDNNMRSCLTVCSQSLKHRLKAYGELYSLDNADVVLFIDDSSKKEEFLKSLNETSEAINQPLNVDEQVIKLDTRMGVVPLDSVCEKTQLEAVLLAGKTAIRNASQTDRMRYYVFRAASFATTRDISTKEGVMELITNGDVDVHFQPQLDITTGKIVGMEALCRIVGERAKEISVASFVEAAEETGLIVELGKFIYEKAMDFAKILQKQNVKVAINVSPIQLMQMGFVDLFLSAFNERGLKKGAVDIEIVESTFIYSMSDIIKKLNVLKKHGVDAQIDDFGVAYSSLFYLKKMPVTTLKIDKVFVDGIGYKQMDDVIVNHIIKLANDLGLNCIAEGVETQEQLDILKKMGCKVVQGYFIGKAMPKEKAYAMIKQVNKEKKEQKDEEKNAE